MNTSNATSPEMQAESSAPTPKIHNMTAAQLLAQPAFTWNDDLCIGTHTEKTPSSLRGQFITLGTFDDDEISKAKAKALLKAVVTRWNSHAALVEALKVARAYIGKGEDLVSTPLARGIGRSVSALRLAADKLDAFDTDPQSDTPALQAMREIDAAIAAAEGTGAK